MGGTRVGDPDPKVWHFIPAKFIFPNKPMRGLHIADPSGRAVDGPAASPCSGLTRVIPEMSRIPKTDHSTIVAGRSCSRRRSRVGYADGSDVLTFVDTLLFVNLETIQQLFDGLKE